MNTRHTILGIVICIAQCGYAQNNAHQTNFDKFVKQMNKDFDDFRSQINEEYADFVRNPWREFEGCKPVPQPKQLPVPPVVLPKGDELKPIENKPIVIEEIIKPIPVPVQPEPIEPIKEQPVEDANRVSLKLFGTACSVRLDKSTRIKLAACDENAIADGIKQLSQGEYDNLILDCLALRTKMQLCDWAYLQLLLNVGEAVCGKGTNEAVLLTSYVFMQSGYKMRLAMADGKLFMLYASRHQVYEKPYYTLDGEGFYGVAELPRSLRICQAKFPKEKSLSLLIPKQPKLSEQLSETRTITSKRYGDVSFTSSINKNLIEFYNTYPASELNDNPTTHWTMYANTPMSQNVVQSVYPVLQEKLKGLSQKEAVERLLNLVQTGLVYDFDDKIWGYDRTFFAEESLFYPYCDCEDRSVLLTRMVRDLLGLKCILVYYPGHLASAVSFPGEEVSGDYIQIGNDRFIICDATYVNAPVGCTMPGMDNTKAKVAILE